MEEILALFDNDKSKVNIPVITQNNNPNNVELTPLCWLIVNKVNYEDIKKFIKDYNPDINALCQFDCSAMKIVCQSDNVKLMKLLLKNGGNVNEYNPESFWGDRPPLHSACRGSLDFATLQTKKNLKMIKTLIDNGADLDLLDKDIKKPLEYLTLGEKAQLGIFDNVIEVDEDDLNYEMY